MPPAPPAPRKPRKAKPRGDSYRPPRANPAARIDNPVMKARAVEMAYDHRKAGIALRESARLISAALKLNPPASHMTIRSWLEAFISADTPALRARREEYYATSLEQLDALIERWLPLATTDLLRIARRKETPGGAVTVIDEDVYAEGEKAANILIRTLEQKRKILGVGLSAAELNKGGSLDGACIGQMVAQILNSKGAPGLQLRELKQVGPVLLAAGDPVIDELAPGV